MKEIIWRDENLKLNDGVELKSRIWYPAKRGQWPALLMRQPYGKEIASTTTYLHPSWWASKGYLVVIQDVRGQGESGGQFNGFKQEINDTMQTHRWVRGLPECNKKLGTYGFSYQGFTQLIAQGNAEAPDCLAPAMTGLNEEKDWSHSGKAFWWEIGITWGLQLAALKAKRSSDYEGWKKIRENLENKEFLREGPILLEKYDPKGMANEWLKASENENYKWREHKPLKEWLKRPMLLIGGWWDPHLCGVLNIYKKSIEAGGSPELFIGPATHLKWWEGAQELHLDFFNRHLKDNMCSEENANNKIKLWNITNNHWEAMRNSKSINYFSLSTTGKASHDTKDGKLKLNEVGDGLINLVHDPWRPVPSIGGHLTSNPGIVNRFDIDNRTDVATFTSHILRESVRWEGIPTLRISAQSDYQGFDICVALSILDEERSEAIQLSTGFLRVRGETSKVKIERKIELQPILADVSAKKYLRISLAGSAWPAIGVNPGDPAVKCEAPGPNCKVVTITFDLEGSKFYISPLLS